MLRRADPSRIARPGATFTIRWGTAGQSFAGIGDNEKRAEEASWARCDITARMRLSFLRASHLAVLLALCAGLATSAPCLAATPFELINTWVDHFNTRNLDGLLALAHDDVEWLTVTGAEITVETRGKEALRASLTSYFASCPSCRSTVEVYQTLGVYTSTVEHAEWQTRSGETKRQSSLAVYEMADGLVRRVWYYPAVAPEPTKATP